MSNCPTCNTLLLRDGNCPECMIQPAEDVIDTLLTPEKLVRLDRDDAQVAHDQLCEHRRVQVNRCGCRARMKTRIEETKKAFTWQCSRCKTLNGIHRDGCRECGLSIYKSQATEDQPSSRPAQIQRMAARFLSWGLPKSVLADTCACQSNYPHKRYGINLLSATEAIQMVEHLLDNEPILGDADLWKAEAERWREIVGTDKAELIKQRDALVEALEDLLWHVPDHVPSVRDKARAILAAVKGGGQ